MTKRTEMVDDAKMASATAWGFTVAMKYSRTTAAAAHEEAAKAHEAAAVAMESIPADAKTGGRGTPAKCAADHKAQAAVHAAAVKA